MAKEKSIKKSNRGLPTKTKEILYNLIKEYDQILEKSPNNYEILRKKGICLQELCFYNSEHIEKTLTCFNKILQINYKDKEIWKRKAALLTRRDTIDEALKCYEEVLELDPQDAEAYWGKGVIMQIDEKPYSAIPYFDKSLELDPLDARTWMQKGFALSARGETWEHALDCFTKALEINSDDPRVWRAKGSIFQKKSDLDNAINHFDKAISLDSKDWESLMLKGFALSGKQNFEDAIKCFDESLSIKQENIEALHGKGNALFYMNKNNEALEIYNSVTLQNPRYVNGWLQKGFCFLKLNDSKKALHSFETTLKLDSANFLAQKEKEKLTSKGISTDDFNLTKTNQSSNENFSIVVNKINKRFKIQHEKKDSLFSVISNPFSKSSYEMLEVLKDISFNLRKGEMLGIIGLNGSGKTTLLKILSGILKADSGRIRINGTIAPLLQLGVGFNGELTAKENIILSGMLLGFSKQEIRNKVDKIIEFAELEKFADTKIKKFSSGMHSRLAFSTAIQIDPDILLVDEVLAVGDINFVKKSYREFLSFREKGKSIIFVSHSLEHIRNLCDRVMVLESGMIRMIGNPDDVIQYYTKQT